MNMIRNISFSLFILLQLFIVPNIKAQTWIWGRGAGTGSGGMQEGWAIATDAAGNAIITGQYINAAVSFGTYTLPNSGGSDFYVVKYDPSGNVLWAKGFGGTSDDQGKGIACDLNGNIFVTGYFSSPTITIGTTTLADAGNYNAFLVKLDPAGNVLWAKKGSSGSDVQAYGVTTDAAGNSYITGGCDSAVVYFGSTVINNPPNSSFEAFLVKYDPSGNVLWAKRGGGTNYDVAYAVTVNASNEIIIGGTFGSSTASFGTFNINASASGDVFVVKYNSSGNEIWAKADGGSATEQVYGIASDHLGNIFLTGYFTSPSISFGTSTLTNNGYRDIFLFKYNSAGNEQWAKSAGNSGDDEGFSVLTDMNNNIYISGGFSANNSILFGNITLPQQGVDPSFIAKYDPSGNVLCANGLDSGGDDNNGIALDPSGDIYLTGDFWIMNPFVIGPDSLYLTGSETVFLAKYYCGLQDVSNLSIINKVSCFPNPSDGHFQISIENKMSSKYDLQITDLLGNIIYRSAIQNSTSDIDIADEAKGIYFLTLISGSKSLCSKIIIQ